MKARVISWTIRAQHVGLEALTIISMFWTKRTVKRLALWSFVEIHNPTPLGGFKIDLNTGETHECGCASPGLLGLFQFAPYESISSIEIYYGNVNVRGVRLHTNASNTIEGSSKETLSANGHCVIERGNLAAIETRPGTWHAFSLSSLLITFYIRGESREYIMHCI